MNFGQRLTKLRTEKKLTKEEVAEILKVKVETVEKWENDEKKPDFDKILPLCELFDVSSDELLTGKKEKETVKKEKKKNNTFAHIQSIVSLLVLIVYLFVSFYTMAWHITWILWIIYALIMEIVKLSFSLKGIDYE